MWRSAARACWLRASSTCPRKMPGRLRSVASAHYDVQVPSSFVLRLVAVAVSRVWHYVLYTICVPHVCCLCSLAASTTSRVTAPPSAPLPWAKSTAQVHAWQTCKEDSACVRVRVSKEVYVCMYAVVAPARARVHGLVCMPLGHGYVQRASVQMTERWLSAVTMLELALNGQGTEACCEQPGCVSSL